MAQVSCAWRPAGVRPAADARPDHQRVRPRDGLRQRAYAEATGILRTEVFIDDDDGKTELHVVLLYPGRRSGCRPMTASLCKRWSFSAGSYWPQANVTPKLKRNFMWYSFTRGDEAAAAQ